MTALVWQPEGHGAKDGGARKRRVHKKSRKGCRNCKIRSVKCDETRPGCKKCTTFGVSCNYDAKVPDLQMSITGTTTMKAPGKPQYRINQAPHSLMTAAPNCVYPSISDDKSTFQLDSQSLDRLGRFQTRTVLSIGTTRGSKLFQKVTIDLACSSPVLMHVVQAITAMHDRYLYESPSSRQTIAENYHLSRAAALFNQKLSEPVRPSDRDALWSTSALLGITAFASIDASGLEEAWPLKQPDPLDLKWIDMSKSKKVIWTLTSPFDPDSRFHSLADEFLTGHLISKAADSGIEDIPFAFIRLCGLDSSSTSANNPYYNAVHALTPLLGIEYDQATIMRFLSFIGNMQPDFRSLLDQKDSIALLLLAYWYASACKSVWWIEKRAILECQAICTYLERYHADEELIQELLQFPKIHCSIFSQSPQAPWV